MSVFTLSRGPSRDDKEYFQGGDPDTLFSDLQEIGHGAFGAVYCALDERPNSATRGLNVAVKKMSYSGKCADKFNDILNEIRLLERLNHKNIVSLMACYLKERDQMAWIVMEYCLGSASDLVDVQPGNLLESEVSQIVRDVLQGLSYLHKNEVIHRDIKAGNILLSDNGLAKLGDFGSASNKSSANSFVGSPYWMAPEVILAMENGRYNGAVDLWSLGITCIEIADRKPPMFTQNAMAALYQIAQSDAPTLDQSADWSNTFHQFLCCLLKKNPEERYTAEEALQHNWFKENKENPQELVELISRTKCLVRDQDEEQITMQYKKMLRIYKGGDPMGQIPRDGSMKSTSSNPISEDHSSDEDDTEYDDDFSRSEQSFHARSTMSDPMNHSLHRPPTIRPIRHNQQNPSNQLPADHQLQGHRLAREQFSQPLGTGLSTIRPATLMKKQEEERIKVSAFREQMGNYKKMRQTHRALMQNLESTLSSEMESHQKKLQNELNGMRRKHQGDRQKLANKRLQIIEKIQKDADNELKAFDRLLYQKEDNERKGMEDKQRDEMRRANQRWRAGELPAGVTRDQQKSSFGRAQQEHLRHFDRKQKQEHEMELRKYRRKRLTSRHNEEQHMLNEELNERSDRVTEENGLMKKHHEMTQLMEYNHMKQVHENRLHHQKLQHEMEIKAQKVHMQQLEQDMSLRHRQALKQAPKNMKEQELKIKKSYHESINLIEKQYKAFKNHITDRFQKSEAKKQLKRMKTERKQRLALMWEQYEKTIHEIKEENKDTISETHSYEAEKLKQSLQKDLTLLQEYQAKRRQHFEDMNKDEEASLTEKVSVRLSLIMQREEKSHESHQNERNAKIRALSDRQAREIEEFDAESLRLGFNTVIIDSRSGNYYLVNPPERNSPGPDQRRRLMTPDEVTRASRSANSSRSSNGTAFR